MEIMTPRGPALVEVDEVERARLLLVLTHGSAGGVDAPDLLAVRDAALGVGASVARVTQAFRVAGARAPGSPARQDEAWQVVLDRLRARWPDVPLVQGGTVPYANLDYAASAPALQSVADAVSNLLPLYSSVHRGAGYLSQLCTNVYESARADVASFVELLRLDAPFDFLQSLLIGIEGFFLFQCHPSLALAFRCRQMSFIRILGGSLVSSFQGTSTCCQPPARGFRGRHPIGTA